MGPNLPRSDVEVLSTSTLWLRRARWPGASVASHVHMYDALSASPDLLQLVRYKVSPEGAVCIALVYQLKS